MPFKSKAQMRWMFAAEERGEVPEGTAKRWANHTKNVSRLPARVKKGGLLDALPPGLVDNLAAVGKEFAESTARKAYQAADNIAEGLGQYLDDPENRRNVIAAAGAGALLGGGMNWMQGQSTLSGALLGSTLGAGGAYLIDRFTGNSLADVLGGAASLLKGGAHMKRVNPVKLSYQVKQAAVNALKSRMCADSTLKLYKRMV